MFILRLIDWPSRFESRTKPEAGLEFGNRVDDPIAPTVVKTGKVKEIVLTGDKLKSRSFRR